MLSQCFFVVTWWHELHVTVNYQMVPAYLMVFNVLTRQFNHLDIPSAVVKTNAIMVNYHDRATIIFFKLYENIEDNDTL